MRNIHRNKTILERRKKINRRSELLKQLNDFSHSPEGKQLISNLQELLKDLRTVSKQLLGEGITITPSKSKEPLIKLPPKPETDDTEKLRIE